MKRLRITVDGRTYEVIVEGADDAGPVMPVRHVGSASVAPASAVSVSSAASVSSSSVSGQGAVDAPAGAVPSPLAGKIVSVDVKAGDSVTEGQRLLTIEAMKMNTLINAPRSGKVSEVLVSPGDSVAEGQGLVVLA